MPGAGWQALGEGLRTFGGVWGAQLEDQKRRDDITEERKRDREFQTGERTARQQFEMLLYELGQKEKARDRQDKLDLDYMNRSERDQAIAGMPEGAGRRRAQAAAAGVQGASDVDFMTAAERDAEEKRALTFAGKHAYETAAGSRRGAPPITTPPAATRNDELAVPPGVRRYIASLAGSGITMKEAESILKSQLANIMDDPANARLNVEDVWKTFDAAFRVQEEDTGASGGTFRGAGGTGTTTPTRPTGRPPVSMGSGGQGALRAPAAPPPGPVEPDWPEQSPTGVLASAFPSPPRQDINLPAPPRPADPREAEVAKLVAEYEAEPDGNRKALLKAKAQKLIAEIRAGQAGGGRGRSGGPGGAGGR